MKIYSPREIRNILNEKAFLIGTVAHCHGCFDLLHIGHIKHLEAVKKMCDVLVVTITADKFVNKGNTRPIFNHTLRAEAVASLGCVDYVAINHSADASKAILKIKPDLYVKGIDYLATYPKGDAEESAIESIGGTMIFTATHKYSSTEIIESLK